MTRPSRAALVATGAGAALLLTYLLLWLGVSRLDVGRSDFTPTYVGATLLRTGHGAQVYDESLQAPLHASLLAPGDHEGNLPVISAPGAALLALPVTALDLPTAFRVWSLLQLVLVALGVAAAVRAAPWPSSTARGVRLGIWAVATAGTGAASTLVLGQWDGLLTLGVGMAYWSWRRDRATAAGAWLAAVAVLVKPHLFLGVAAFLLFRRDRRALVGAAGATVAVSALSLALVGPHGIADFVRILAGDANRWPLAEFLGFSGLFGSWLGNTATAQALAAVCSAGAVAACGVLGVRSRVPAQFETALAGTMALTLVASPHLYGHDLVLLAPAAAWMLARAARLDGAQPWPGARSRRMLMLWLLFNCAAVLDFGNGHPAPPGRLVPLALVAAGALSLRALRPRVATVYSGSGSGVGGVVDQS
jgi:alpha-1,2-mannosyltransferase